MHLSSWLLALWALTPMVTAQTRDAPKDFALRLIGGSCLVDEIDTFRGRYSRDLGRGKHASARFSLSAKQKSELFQRIQDAAFFSYPSKYSPPGSSYPRTRRI
jgi:hypothetical protein